MILYSLEYAKDFDVMAFPLVDEAENLHEYYKLIPQHMGIHDIGCHCDGYTFYKDRLGRYPYSIEEMVDIVYETGWNGEDLVRLFACYAGIYDDGAAQELASALNAPVKAPAGLLVVTEDGDAYVLDNVPASTRTLDLDDALAEADLDPNVQADLWRIFTP